jgi:hypothetical protein
VPDVDFDREKLGMNGFKENPGSKMTVTDRDTKMEVDLHSGPLPLPTQVSDEPQILTLPGLISARLSTYVGRGIARAQDYADVVKLIEANHLAWEYAVDPKVRDLYYSIWDELNATRS